MSITHEGRRVDIAYTDKYTGRQVIGTLYNVSDRRAVQLAYSYLGAVAGTARIVGVEKVK